MRAMPRGRSDVEAVAEALARSSGVAGVLATGVIGAALEAPEFSRLVSEPAPASWARRPRCLGVPSGWLGTLLVEWSGCLAVGVLRATIERSVIPVALHHGPFAAFSTPTGGLRVR